MTNTAIQGLPRWTLAVPFLAFVVLLLSWHRDLGAVLLILVCLGLVPRSSQRSITPRSSRIASVNPSAR